jgi:hypothetical protein
MAKPRKKDSRGPLQRFYDTARTEAEQSSLDVLTEAQRAKQEYTGNGRTFRRDTLLDRWFREGGPGFGEGAALAVKWCQKAWESQGIIGRLSAAYEPTIGGSVNHEHVIEMREELIYTERLFPKAHWSVFESVVRHGQPAGVAGSDLATNTPQATASAKAIVGMVASMIAMQRGY